MTAPAVAGFSLTLGGARSRGTAPPPLVSAAPVGAFITDLSDPLPQQRERLVIPLAPVPAPDAVSSAPLTLCAAKRGNVDDATFATLFAPPPARAAAAAGARAQPLLLAARAAGPPGSSAEAQDPSDERYASVPVDAFGAAMLRGMGLTDVKGFEEESGGGGGDGGDPPPHRLGGGERGEAAAAALAADARRGRKRLGLGAAPNPLLALAGGRAGAAAAAAGAAVSAQAAAAAAAAGGAKKRKVCVGKFPHIVCGAFVRISDTGGAGFSGSMMGAWEGHGVGLILQAEGVPGIENCKARVLKRRRDGEGGWEEGLRTEVVLLSKTRAGPFEETCANADEAHTVATLRAENEAAVKEVAREAAARAAAATAPPPPPPPPVGTWPLPGVLVKVPAQLATAAGALPGAVRGVVLSASSDGAMLRVELPPVSGGGGRGPIVLARSADVETVVPRVGGTVRILAGPHRGRRAELSAIHVERYAAELRLLGGEGVDSGGEVFELDYEAFSKEGGGT